MMTFAVGSLVRARGREWVVLPESEPDLLVLRPLGATDAEIAGILPALEPVETGDVRLRPTRAGLGDAPQRRASSATRCGSASARAPARFAASARSRSSPAPTSSCR